MAESISVFIKANGTDIEGESTIAERGGVDVSKSIEVVQFEQTSATPRDPTSGRSAVGQRQHQPIKFLKRMDKSSPLLMQALCQNQVVDAEFKFFRPNPEDGTTQHFYTVKAEGGRITSIRGFIENTLEQSNAHEPPLEECEVTFNKCTWSCVSGSTEYQDSWSTRG
jgi:type VI secretion system secreted protein Hcp